MSLERQLSFFAHWDKTGAQLQGGCSSEDESARINAYHGINHAGLEVAYQQVNASSKQPGVGQQRSNVFEEDSSLWKIGNTANRLLDFRQRRTDFGHSYSQVRTACAGAGVRKKA